MKSPAAGTRRSDSRGGSVLPSERCRNPAPQAWEDVNQEWHVEGSPKGKSTNHLDFVRKSSDQLTADPASLQRPRPSVGLLAQVLP
jgi:hypothetical protein